MSFPKRSVDGSVQARRTSLEQQSVPFLVGQPCADVHVFGGGDASFAPVAHAPDAIVVTAVAPQVTCAPQVAVARMADGDLYAADSRLETLENTVDAPASGSTASHTIGKDGKLYDTCASVTKNFLNAHNCSIACCSQQPLPGLHRRFLCLHC